MFNALSSLLFVHAQRKIMLAERERFQKEWDKFELLQRIHARPFSCAGRRWAIYARSPMTGRPCRPFVIKLGEKP